MEVQPKKKHKKETGWLDLPWEIRVSIYAWRWAFLIEPVHHEIKTGKHNRWKMYICSFNIKYLKQCCICGIMRKHGKMWFPDTNHKATICYYCAQGVTDHWEKEKFI